MLMGFEPFRELDRITQEASLTVKRDGTLRMTPW
jgi:hypothetical protein